MREVVAIGAASLMGTATGRRLPTAVGVAAMETSCRPGAVWRT